MLSTPFLFCGSMHINAKLPNKLNLAFTIRAISKGQKNRVSPHVERTFIINLCFQKTLGSGKKL